MTIIRTFLIGCTFSVTANLLKNFLIANPPTSRRKYPDLRVDARTLSQNRADLRELQGGYRQGKNRRARKWRLATENAPIGTSLSHLRIKNHPEMPFLILCRIRGER
jgi:hypothetical protein